MVIDNTAKGGLTKFLELFSVIPCAPKHRKMSITSLFEDIFGCQIETESIARRSYLMNFGSKH